MAVQGQSRLNAKLSRLPQAAKNKIMESLAQSAREITNLMEVLVPKDSGALAGSIGWTWGDAPKGSFAIAQSKQGDMVLTIYAGDREAYYARWIEFGTVKMGAQPFFFPAYRALRKRARSRIARNVNQAMKQVANG